MPPRRRQQEEVDLENPGEGETGGSPEGQEQQGLKWWEYVTLSLCLQLSLIVFWSIILSVQQVLFVESWEVECDYALKVWSTTWVSRQWLVSVWILLIVIVNMRRRNRLTKLSMRIPMLLIDLFGFAWWLYGIKIIFVDDNCDPTTSTLIWAEVFWYTQLVLILLPLFACCCCLPILICLQYGNGPEDTVKPTPQEALDRIEVRRWASFSLEVKGEPSPSLSLAETETAASIISMITASILGAVGEVPADRRQSEISRSSIAVVRPERRRPTNTNDCGGDAGNAAGSGDNNVSSQDNNASSGDNNVSSGDNHGAASAASGEESCPICYIEFEDDDEVAVLPCSKMHFFHKDCAFSWLAQSQLCPMCRANVATLVLEKGAEKTEGEGGRSSSVDGSSIDTPVILGRSEESRRNTLN